MSNGLTPRRSAKPQGCPRKSSDAQTRRTGRGYLAEQGSPSRVRSTSTVDWRPTGALTHFRRRRDRVWRSLQAVHASRPASRSSRPVSARTRTGMGAWQPSAVYSARTWVPGWSVWAGRWRIAPTAHATCQLRSWPGLGALGCGRAGSHRLLNGASNTGEMRPLNSDHPRGMWRRFSMRSTRAQGTNQVVEGGQRSTSCGQRRRFNVGHP